ncbi:MAG: molybdopterin molybdenumtransferase MoeA, partial [Granulosicoccaceae bacterium]
LRHMMGMTVTEPLLFKARCETPLRKTRGRVEYQRGILCPDTDGQMTVRTTGKQGAGRISSMTDANCFIVLPPDLAEVVQGDLVDVQPFEGLV